MWEKFFCQVSGGASIPDQKLMETVSATLRLLASLLTTLPDHLPAFVHFIQQTIVLLRRYDLYSCLIWSNEFLISRIVIIISCSVMIVTNVIFCRISQVSRPPGQLVATLMEFLTEVSTQDPKLVWNELESCPLLPFLAAPHKYGGLSALFLLKYWCSAIDKLFLVCTMIILIIIAELKAFPFVINCNRKTHKKKNCSLTIQHHIHRSKERESRPLPWVPCWCPESPSLRWRGSDWEIPHPKLLHTLIDLWC